MNTTQFKAAATLSAYFLTLIAFAVGSSYLSGRVWGINIWSAPPGVWTLSIVGVVAGALIWLLPIRNISRGENNSIISGNTYVFLSLGLIVLFSMAFYFFRAQTHFLGDGYTLISLLGDENPLIKQREIGEALIHIWVKNLFGLSGESGALVAFQIISISSGTLYLTALTIAAGKLFESNIRRVLFVLGMMGAGNALLFFGYVENYSAFSLSVLIVTLIGALSVSGVVSKLWTIPALAFSIWLHALGVTLIPGVVYALARDTRPGRLFANLALRRKLILAVVMLALFGAPLLYFYRTNIFFEAALLAVTPSRFTVEGYTLFSRAHLIDSANLLILLCPWGLIALTLLFSKRRETFRAESRRPIVRFLVILSVSVAGSVFVFDPKVGMPRDWDLFSFAAIPMTILFYVILFKRAKDIRFAVKIAALSIALSFLALIPRVTASRDEQSAVRRIESYIVLDKKKNRTAMQLLQQFYVKRGDTAATAELGERYIKAYPEIALTRRATKLGQGGRIDSALALLHQALTINPMYAPAYLNLGRAFRATQNYDSALYYLEIADGLNPFNEFITSELGQVYQELGDVYFREGKLERAREQYRNAIEFGRDSSLLSR